MTKREKGSKLQHAPRSNKGSGVAVCCGAALQQCVQQCVALQQCMQQCVALQQCVQQCVARSNEGSGVAVCTIMYSETNSKRVLLCVQTYVRMHMRVQTYVRMHSHVQQDRQ